VRAGIRREGAAARWQRYVAAGECNQEAAAALRKRTKAAAQRAGVPRIDFSRIKKGRGKVTAEEARRASADTDAGSVAIKRCQAATQRAQEARERRGRSPWDIGQEARAAVRRLWSAPAARDDEWIQKRDEQSSTTNVSLTDLKSVKPDTCGNDAAIMGFLTLAAAQHGGGGVKVMDSLRVG